ncbi:polysaccharide pyruvyl transferase family protein [Rhizobium sp. SIMBA_035]
MKIVVFNVKYSENLGDGLLADCIETTLRAEGIEVETLDLAGRTAVGTSRNRSLILNILRHLPARLRRAVVTKALAKQLRESSRIWDAKIAAADAVILGGGNLFQDDDLNFPLKVGTLLDCAARQGKPLAIYAVGVGPHWSEPAKRLFRRLQDTRLAHLSVRDGFAYRNWLEYFPSGPVPQIEPDPGLLAASLVSGDLPAVHKSVGLCVTEPKILARHASRPALSIPLTTVSDYRDLISHLTGAGYRVTLFSNGAGEDQKLAETVLSSCRAAGIGTAGTLRLADRPRDPQQLLAILRQNSVIAAHRLHACIAAHAMRIPAVGLAWDGKVEGFFREMNRSGAFAAAGTSPAGIAAMVMRADQEGLSSEVHHEQVTATRSALTNVCATLFGLNRPDTISRSKKRNKLVHNV